MQPGWELVYADELGRRVHRQVVDEETTLHWTTFAEGRRPADAAEAERLLQEALRHVLAPPEEPGPAPPLASEGRTTDDGRGSLLAFFAAPPEPARVEYLASWARSGRPVLAWADRPEAPGVAAVLDTLEGAGVTIFRADQPHGATAAFALLREFSEPPWRMEIA